MVGGEAAELHRAADRPAARQVLGLEVDVHIAGVEVIALVVAHADRAGDRHALAVEVVAAVIRGDRHRTLVEPDLGGHAVDVDDPHRARLLDRLAGVDFERLALVVSAGVARLFDPHPLARLVGLVLVEQEADFGLLAERGDGEEQQQRKADHRQAQLEQPHEPVMRASRSRPAGDWRAVEIGRFRHARKYPARPSRQGRAMRGWGGSRNRPGRAPSAFRATAACLARP